MSDVIRSMARRAAAAKDAGQFNRVSELYTQACQDSPDKIEQVRSAFAEVGIRVGGHIPRRRPYSMIFAIKG